MVRSPPTEHFISYLLITDATRTRLLAINGISLGCALISNFSLLLNMARRLKFSIAQPITITGWYIASFLLIGDISGIVQFVQKPHERRALTQAFYYAIFAATLYFIIASLMVVTVYGAWRKHYSREFKLNTSQRTLMLQTISFMIYSIGGAAMYAKIEGWHFLDAVYFVNFTLLTVGVGDYAPMTHLGRGLLFPFAFGGIVVLGLVIGSIRSLVLERGKDKLGSRMTEKKREAVLRELFKKGDEQRITPIESGAQAKAAGLSERQRREEEFNLMRKVQESTATRQKWISLSLSGGAWLVLWLIGALVFYFAEHEQGWTYFQSLYFAYTTLLTIGYGDFKPFSNSGKAFFVLWSLLAVPTLTIVISNLGDTVVKVIRDLTLYLGEFTVLPGDAGVRTRLKQSIDKVKKTENAEPQHTHGQAHDAFIQPPGLLREEGRDEEEEVENETAVQVVEDTELHPSQPSDRETGSGGGFIGSSVHEYHYLLAKESRKVMKHLNEAPPRQYPYKEWCYYLKLLGEDESSSASHRRPEVDPRRDGKVEMQQAQTSQSKEWSWVGAKSPLMGEVEEAEWVLQKLTEKLETSLREMHERERGKKAGSSSGGSDTILEREESKSDGAQKR